MSVRTLFAVGAVLAGVLAFPGAPMSAVAAPAARLAADGVAVQGNVLVRDGQPYDPLGFTLVGLLSPPACSNGAGAAARAHLGQPEMTAALAWHADTLRFQVSYVGLSGYSASLRATYLQQIEAGVQLARANGMAVILSLQDQGVGCGQGRALPPVGAIRVWRQLARTFGDDPYVMFELWNEPGNRPLAQRLPPGDPRYDEVATWPDWLNGRPTPLHSNQAFGETYAAYSPTGHQQLVGAVRSTGATNVIIADGADKAERLEGIPMLRDSLAVPQIAYAAHPYYFQSSPADWDRRFGYLTASVPVVVTEWNMDCGAARQTMMAPAFLAYLQQHHIGMTAWSFDMMNTLISDWSWTPTNTQTCGYRSAGATVQAYFTGYPTQLWSPHPS